jgi:4-hydroxy-3-methylbut-2-enyl diphosphate reductase
VRSALPQVREPKQQDICYATQNRQDAVKVMSPAGGCGDCGGQPHQLQQQPPGRAGRKLGVDSYMVDSADELQAEWLEGKARVGLTAGASAPEVLVPR